MKNLNYWNEVFFNVFPDLAFVRGENEASIYDFKRNVLLPIPLVLCDIVDQLKEEPCGAIISQLDKESQNYFVQYLNYLHKNDIGAFIGQRICFKPLELTWDFPAAITIAQLGLSNSSNFNPFYAIEQIIDQGCHQIEFRLKNIWGKPSKVEALLEAVSTSSVRGIHLYISHGQDWCPSSVKKLFEKYPKLLFFNAFNAESNFTENLDPGAINLSSKKWTEEYWKTNQFQNRYIVNLNYFTEAQKFHPLLNRKVCLDETGVWKNDFLYENSHGHLNEVLLKELISLDDFTKWWHINPDMILDLKASSRRYAILPIQPLVPIYGSDGLYKFSPLSRM